MLLIIITVCLMLDGVEICDLRVLLLTVNSNLPEVRGLTEWLNYITREYVE